METKLNIYDKQSTFEKTLKNYQPYINKIASTLCYDNFIFEELVQVGSIQLWKCYSKYNSTLNDNFKGYVGVNIKRSMQRYLSSSSRTVRIPELKVLDKNYIQPIEISISTMIGEDTSIADTLVSPSTDKDIDDLQLNKLILLEKYLTQLKPIQVKVIQLRLEEGMTFQQISDNLGLPNDQSSINKFNAAILKLKRNFNTLREQ